MDHYKEGTVFELDENSGEEYIIIKNTKLDNEIYLVVSPLVGENNNKRIDVSDVFILKVDSQTDDVDFVKDEKIISSVIDMIFGE